MTQSNKPQIHHAEIVAQSRLFKIESNDLEFSNGEKRTYERLINGTRGAVLVVPVLDDDTVLLVREYCGGTQRYELGFPKGKIDEGETAEQAALRECMEEIGYGARQLTVLKTVSLAPGYMTHHTHIVMAQDLYEQSAQGDEPEPLEVVPWKLNEFEALMARDDCTEGRSLLAVLLAREFLAK